jgi:hypothetical protein
MHIQGECSHVGKRLTGGIDEIDRGSRCCRLDRGGRGPGGVLEKLTSELMNIDDQATRENLKPFTAFMLQVLRDIH